jgi:RNA polymerase subunit RPABC4/transcription elongation factor Spt4
MSRTTQFFLQPAGASCRWFLHGLIGRSVASYSGGEMSGMSCRDCGSIVTRSDRYCPACGTPNLACKFQPKFAPALRPPVDARIVTESAPAGAPSCPRCHRLIDARREFCAGCGMARAGAVIERRSRPRRGQVPVSPVAWMRRSHRPGRESTVAPARPLSGAAARERARVLAVGRGDIWGRY